MNLDSRERFELRRIAPSDDSASLLPSAKKLDPLTVGVISLKYWSGQNWTNRTVY